MQLRSNSNLWLWRCLNLNANGLLILCLCIVESATNESYLPPPSEEQLLSTNKRFQQIMQGGSPADIGWPQQLKPKIEKIDVKAEIAKLNTTYVYQSAWPEADVQLGSVTAVSFDKAGNVVIFHRVDRMWDQTTFNNANIFMQRKKGPIRGSTVLAFEHVRGELVYEWGKNIFYMPHGLTVDDEDNVWVTDVALHQVFKFGPRGSGDKPLMTLGTAFAPGAGNTNFCKPTSVAVLPNGDFFVADGYCNARILKYSKNGQKILSWGQNTFAGVSFDVAPPNYFAIPHALTLVPEQQLVCTADRENGRLQCFHASNGTFHSQYHSQIIGDRLFSMDYTPAEGGQFIIVNGPTAEYGVKTQHYNEVRGYVVNMRTKQVTSKFGPNDLQFANPHDVAVTVDGLEVYVAELNPTRVYKFLHKSLVKPVSLSASKPTATAAIGPEYELSPVEFVAASGVDAGTTAKTHSRPGGTAILVASLMLLFALLTFAMALLIARRRKRGCVLLPFGMKNRRHAWDFPTKPEGFNLGGLLLDRGRGGKGKRGDGFEKLDQNASDEEQEANANMLQNAPFA